MSLEKLHYGYISPFILENLARAERGNAQLTSGSQRESGGYPAGQ